MLKIPNAPVKSPDVQLFERNFFSPKQVIFLIFQKNSAARMDIIMFIEPMVLEAPTGIAGQPRWFSRQEAGQQQDAGAHNSAYESFLSSEKENPIIFQGERKIGNTHKLGTK